MRGGIRRSWMLVAALVCAVLCGAMPNTASAQTDNPRHGVVCLEGGVVIDDTWIPYGSGTAFFVGHDGQDPQYLITNQHVTDLFEQNGGGQMVTFMLDDGTEVAGRAMLRAYFDSSSYQEAYLIESDDKKDLAVLKLNQATSLRSPLTIGIIGDKNTGDPIRVIGYPGISENALAGSTTKRGESDATITTGAISLIFVQSGTGVQQIQTDADIMRGNSGGPMVDANGNVVGVNTWGYVNGQTEEVNYAINIVEAIPLLDRNNIAYDVINYATDGDSNGGTGTSGNAGKTGGEGTEGKDGAEGKDGTEGTGSIPINNGGNTSQSQPLSPLAIAGIVVGVVAVAGVIVFLVMRNKKSAPAAPAAAQPAAAQTPPQQFERATPPQNQSQQFSDDSGFRLQGVSGALAGKLYAVPASLSLTIGRNPDNGIVVPQSTKGVSGRHCEIWIDGGQIFLRDLGSTYGTFVDPGSKLATGQGIVIGEGTLFWLGARDESFCVIRKRG